MKKYISFIFMLFALSCTKRYFVRGSIDPNFNTGRMYKVAVFPFMIRGTETAPSSDVRDRLRDYLEGELMETGKFSFIDKFTIKRLINIYEFGTMGEIDPSLARNIGKELGAELVVLTILELNPVKGELPIIANVQILDVKSSNVVYTGQARVTNPVSLEAGAEFAIHLAIKKFVEKLK